MTETIKNCTDDAVSQDCGAVATTQETTRATRRPSLTSRATDDGLEVRFELPGVARDGIALTVEDGELRLAAATTLTDRSHDTAASHVEFRVADYAGRWTLPEDVTAEGAKSSFENGVLRLTLPRHTATRHSIAIG